MTRWTLLAIALVVAGCGDRDNERAEREGSDAAATADTALQSERDTTETKASGAAKPEAAPVKTAPAARTPAKPSPKAPAAEQGPSGEEAMGGVRSPSAPR